MEARPDRDEAAIRNNRTLIEGWPGKSRFGKPDTLNALLAENSLWRKKKAEMATFSAGAAGSVVEAG